MEEGSMKRSYFVIVLVCLFCLGFICCAPEKEELNLEQVRSAVEQANMKLAEALRQGDSAGMAMAYTEDATLMPNGADMIKGRPGIEAYWSAAIQMGVKDVVLTVLDLGGGEEFVYEIGKVLTTVQMEGLEPMEIPGKYACVWKKADDGTWKIHLDIWNNNAPAQ
jgi:ketosteroid isomerase-like protein